MLTLKTYQTDALDALGAFFDRVHAYREAERGSAGRPPLPIPGGPVGAAYAATTEETLGLPVPYHDLGARGGALAGLRGVPFVCLRLPTGAGKTLVAAHAVGVARQRWQRADAAVVLWLVPGEAILTQTLRALRDPAHPYRQALVERSGGAGLGGGVRVVDRAEALGLTAAQMDGQTVVIVATMQAFRTSTTEGRKVYGDSSPLLTHFTGANAALAHAPGLEPFAGAAADEAGDADAGADAGEAPGRAAYSLVNVLRLRRPIVVIDEAHNARTGLSFDTIARVAPSCVIEFTATPKRTGADRSNVLVSVTAAQLKAEGMIKLPLVLTTHADWRRTLDAAVGQRAALERDALAEEAAGTPYLRPLLLVQAQAQAAGQDRLTVDVLRAYLTGEGGMREEEVVIHTGEQRGLAGVDVASRASPVRAVITVQALREGWDAPSAYVLAALGNVTAETAVEQLVGRVLRMPGATPRATAALNRAYVFAATGEFGQTLRALQDALVETGGFDPIEAVALVRAATPAAGDASPDLFASPGLFDALDRGGVPGPADPPAGVPVVLPGALDVARLPDALRPKVAYDPDARVLYVRADLTDADHDALVALVPPADAAVVRAGLAGAPRVARTPAERGERFDVPVFAVRQGDLFVPLGERHLTAPTWTLADAPSTLPDFHLPTDGARTGTVDVGERDRLTGQVADPVAVFDAGRQARLFAQDGGWDEGMLRRFLDRNTIRPEVTQAENRAYLTRVVRHLVAVEGMALSALVQHRYALAAALRARIEAVKREADAGHVVGLLFGPEATRAVVREDVVFSFGPGGYAPSMPYTGARAFPRHHYGPPLGTMNREEEAIALEIDGHPNVATWVRNLERDRRRAFWLPTPDGGAFFPDFVVRLLDGTAVVVEHKGAHLWDASDAVEKRRVGEAWAARSGGRCRFAMTQSGDLSALRAALG